MGSFLLPDGAEKCQEIVNISLVRIAFAELIELSRKHIERIHIAGWPKKLAQSLSESGENL